MNIVPLMLYVVAGVAYAVQFSRRNLNASRVASTLLIVAAFAHTFIIGMETMRAGHVPFASATSAISTFVWLLALSYLYVELTSGERAMGAFRDLPLSSTRLVPVSNAFHASIEVELILNPPVTVTSAAALW